MPDLVSAAHSGLAMLAFAATLAFAASVFAGPSRLATPRRIVYVIAMAATGLVGVTGLVTTALGGWWPVLFPYVGLVAVVIHGVAGVLAKRSLAAGRTLPAAIAAGLQVLALTAAYGLMTVKPW